MAKILRTKGKGRLQQAFAREETDGVKGSGHLTIPSDEPNNVLPADWLMTPRLMCSSPCEEALTYVEANDGSSPSTTEFPGTTTLSEGPVSDSSSKWDTTSDTVRAESGSKEIGGISNSSSPRLGV